MTRPPLLARVRFRGHRVGLWLPLFLVWLVLLPILLPLLVLFLFAALVAPRRWRLLPFAGGAWAVLCATRGAELELADARRGVSIFLV